MNIDCLNLWTSAGNFPASSSEIFDYIHVALTANHRDSKTLAASKWRGCASDKKIFTPLTTCMHMYVRVYLMQLWIHTNTLKSTSHWHCDRKLYRKAFWSVLLSMFMDDVDDCGDINVDGGAEALELLPCTCMCVCVCAYVLVAETSAWLHRWCTSQ